MGDKITPGEDAKLTPLEHLYVLRKIAKINTEDFCQNIIIDISYRSIENALKALEIIKNKKVNVGDFVRCKTIEDYNDYLCYGEKEKLTQEEFELLKEVLL